MAKKKKARGRPKASPMEALMAYQKSHPKAPYAEVAKAMEKKGHKVYPIMFGRAQSLLGQVKTKPRAGKKAEAKAKAAPANGRRRRRVAGARSRRPGRAGADGVERLRSVLDEYEAIRRERDELRAAFEEVQRTVAGVRG